MLIIIILSIKYKIVYEVKLKDEEVGYIQNKDDFEKKIDEILNKKDNDNVAFITIDALPKYEIKLVNKKENINESEILQKLKQNSETVYQLFAITLDDSIRTYLKSEEEANQVVDIIKEKYENNKLNLNVKQIYSKQKTETVSIKIATEMLEKENLYNINKENLQDSYETINEIKIAVKPVIGTITSRFGEVSILRTSTHTGLDIAAKKGTEIKACATGIISFEGYKGSYGNLIIILHGNGVETYYGHCSKINVKQGQKVEAGEIIGAVGSTGNSTGPHLHFEIRINGEIKNPQKYLYK